VGRWQALQRTRSTARKAGEIDTSVSPAEIEPEDREMTKQPLSNAGKAVEELLPFYAAGVLSPSELAEIKRILAVDAELRRRLVLIEEEQTEAILLNEGIAGPSTQALDKLMAAISAEPEKPGARFGLGAGLAQRLGGWLQALTPRQAAFATAAAALVLAIQAGALVGLMVKRDDTGGFQTASHGAGQVASQIAAAGSAFTVIFQPDAKAADIAALLERIGARIVDGPRAGGIYRIQVGDKGLDATASAAIVAWLRAEAALVRLVSSAP
jgi:hypothetical protein